VTRLKVAEVSDGLRVRLARETVDVDLQVIDLDRLFEFRPRTEDGMLGGRSSRHQAANSGMEAEV
jgi:hypothetical protein